MKVIFVVFTISALVLISWAGDLKFVSVVYRHGDRSPNHIYPTNPYSSSIWKKFVNKTGQLTNLGKNQSYQLGKYIRNRYQDFIPIEYNEDDIHVLSSHFSRTLMTAYCVLAGLYEPKGNDVWLENMNWQPIPVHIVPKNVDNLMAKRVPCPKYEQLLDNQVLVELSETVDKYKDIIKELLPYTGYSMPNRTIQILETGSKVYDCLFVEEAKGLTLPEWTKKFYPQPLLNLTRFRFAVRSYNAPVKRLRCGPLVKDIIHQLDKVKQGTSKLKMWHYSAHDSTIVDLLQCLSVYDGELVPYSSIIFFELYEAENDFEVSIYYKKNDEVKELVIPGCKSRCPLDMFKELLKDVTPDNWKEECKV